jgi:hypothetical protein
MDDQKPSEEADDFSLKNYINPNVGGSKMAMHLLW